jgi:anti-sigma factor RsiW
MKHPNREQWISFLYKECDPAEQTELATHLKVCPTCREQVDTWGNTTAALDTYKIERRAQPNWQTVPWLRWSAAAAALLAIGIGIGATVQARANPNDALVAELRNRVEKSEAAQAETKKFLVELTQTIAENRAKDQAALLATAEQLQATRQDLETVALTAQSQLVRLASYNPR